MKPLRISHWDKATQSWIRDIGIRAEGEDDPIQKSSLQLYIDDALAVEEKVAALLAIDDLTITAIKLSVDVAPTGAAIIVDIHKNGVTLYTTQDNRPTIAIGETSATAELPDIVTLTKGDRITVDIDQVGSTIAGENLIVLLECEVA